MIISLKSVKLVRQFFFIVVVVVVAFVLCHNGSANEINNLNGYDPCCDGSKCFHFAKCRRSVRVTIVCAWLG